MMGIAHWTASGILYDAEVVIVCVDQTTMVANTPAINIIMLIVVTARPLIEVGTTSYH